MTKSIKEYIEQVSHLAIWPLRFLFLIALLAAMVPMSPGMPSPGLDGSWVYGLGEAVARKFVFGKDMVFTLGPYSSIYTSSYHPATYLFTLFASIYMALDFAVLLFYLLSGRSLLLSFLLLFFLSCNVGAPDATLLVFPLLLSLFVYRLTLRENDSQKIHIRRPHFKYLVIFFVFGVLGLIPLVKGSLLILAVAAGGLSTLRLCLTGNFRLAVISVVAVATLLLLFWTITGQPIGGLPYYFVNMFPIASGYTEAMSTKGKVAQINIYLISWMVSAIAITIERNLTWRNKSYLLATFGLFLFVAFKEGFVRHDAHAAIAGSALFLAGISLCTVLRGNWRWVALTALVLAWFSICNAYYPMSPPAMATQARNTYARLGNGLLARLQGTKALDIAFEDSRDRLKQEHPIPKLQGTTDIYPFDQTYLLASANTWSPRPVFQSYSAYTPQLADMNRIHLLGPSAPDNIIFSLQPIDGRLPSLEDGPSWPVLMDRYKPMLYEDGFLYLKKGEDSTHPADMKPFFTEDHKIDEVVTLPNVTAPVFAQISMKRSLMERIESIFFKPAPLRITLNLLDGSSRNYRFVPGMGEAGFVLSPLVENTTDFLLSYDSWRYLENKRVTSISIAVDSKHSSGWRGYTLTLSRLPSQMHADINSLIGIVEPTKYNDHVDPTSRQNDCFGSVDYINGALPSTHIVSYSTLLSIQGWMADSKDKLGYDDFVIALTPKDGATYVAPLVRYKRPDVAAYLKSDALENSGYQAFIKTDAFNGSFDFAIAKKVPGGLAVCTQYRYSIEQGEH